jgi:hypothetical protein
VPVIDPCTDTIKELMIFMFAVDPDTIRGSYGVKKMSNIKYNPLKRFHLCFVQFSKQ